MLILSRLTGERIMLDVPASATATRIEVQLVEVRGMRLGGNDKLIDFAAIPGVRTQEQTQ